MTRLLRYLILLSLLLQVGYIPSDRLTAKAESLSPAWSPIVITSPTSLTPMPDAQDPLCKTYWYIIENAGGYPAYLTLNVETEAGSTNAGEWRPNIPTTGFYKVEVYIPDHVPFFWGCSYNETIESDTADAVYKITSLNGTATINVDQSANHGTWVSLGNYLLAQGVGNSLQLTDITGETNFQYSVSFSMARFTWVNSQSKYYFPIIYKDWDQASLTKVRLDSVTPYAREGISRVRFDMDEPVTYRIFGTNGYTAPEPVRLTWQYSGPCGYGPESEVTLTLPVGSWSYDLAGTIAACPGQNTATIRIYSRGAMLQKSLNINVDGGGTLRLFQGHAFDACHLPSINDMSMWWNHSPYSVVNIYMGGISFATGCNYSGLSRDWVKNVQNIGWGYIPTWVGPQAPCSDLKYRFSFDTTTAYNQGKQEAQLAAAKAIQLGLVGASNPDTILYYDMEGYSYADNAKDLTVREACKVAVNWFLHGWVDQLHSYGISAAAYGGTSSSYMHRWWEITPRLDAIWAAEWMKSGYDPSVTVFDISMNGGFWANHQRIWQYAGDHFETWGGRTLAIDSDVADSLLYLPRFPIIKPQIAADQSLITENQVTDFQLLTLEQGWMLDRNILYWTKDGGKTWQPIDIQLEAGANLEEGYFLDVSRGWLLVSNADSSALISTMDSGATWQTFTLPDYGPVDPLELTFETEVSGFIKFRFQTSQAFREGYILRTLDGGLTWQRGVLAQDDPAWDMNPSGLEAIIKSAAGIPAVPDGTIRVEWASDSVGWARVFRSACNGGGEADFNCQTAVVLMITVDGGVTWTEIHP